MFLYQCHAPAYQVYSSSSSTETPQQISIKKETENRKRKHTSIKEKSARKKQCKTGEKSSKSFSDMPDEILLKIFSFLDMKHLLRCAQLSKRINPICHDESLWQEVDLAQFKSVSTGLLELLCKNGCKHLSLQSASLKGNLTLKNCLSKLRTLDLACFQGPDVAWSVLDVDLEKLLDPCHFLQKLSLTGLEIKMKLLRTICLQNWRTLQALKCHSFHVDLKSIQCIIKNCVQLTEIDFCFSSFSTAAIKFLVRNLSTNTEKLKLSSGVSDEDVKILVSRCNKLRVLDLSHNGITKKSLKSIIANLKHTLEELAIQSTKIDIADLLQLDSNIMPKLRILNCKGDYDKDLDSDLDSDSDSDSEKGSDEEEENDFGESESLKELKLVLPHLSINENDLEIAEIETDGFLKINSDDIGTDDDSEADETDDSNAKEELKHF